MDWRFTPTGVGTMTSAAQFGTATPVHPHGRGDNDAARSSNHDTTGSPPRAWGQCARQHANQHRQRFTPTGVGTMLIGGVRPTIPSVHPHGRGDNGGSSLGAMAAGGSPPRAWGQSILDAGEERNLRFTPTGVGTILASQAF